MSVAHFRTKKSASTAYQEHDRRRVGSAQYWTSCKQHHEKKFSVTDFFFFSSLASILTLALGFFFLLI